MALDGGGGGGGLVGSSNSFTGTSSGFEYNGDFAYIYSGSFTSSTTEQTVIDGTTGSQMLVGEFQLNACVATGSPNVGAITGADIKFNGQLIARIKADGQAETTPQAERQAVVIPPYTQVEITVDSDQDQAARLGTVTFVGRIYR